MSPSVLDPAALHVTPHQGKPQCRQADQPLQVLATALPPEYCTAALMRRIVPNIACWQRSARIPLLRLRAELLRLLQPHPQRCCAC